MIVLFFAFNARCSHFPETWTCVLMDDVLMCFLLGVGINVLDDDSKITGIHLISMIFSMFLS